MHSKEVLDIAAAKGIHPDLVERTLSSQKNFVAGLHRQHEQQNAEIAAQETQVTLQPAEETQASEFQQFVADTKAFAERAAALSKSLPGPAKDADPDLSKATHFLALQLTAFVQAFES